MSRKKLSDLSERNDGVHLWEVVKVLESCLDDQDRELEQQKRMIQGLRAQRKHYVTTTVGDINAIAVRAEPRRSEAHVDKQGVRQASILETMRDEFRACHTLLDEAPFKLERGSMLRKRIEILLDMLAEAKKSVNVDHIKAVAHPAPHDLEDKRRAHWRKTEHAYISKSNGGYESCAICGMYKGSWVHKEMKAEKLIIKPHTFVANKLPRLAHICTVCDRHKNADLHDMKKAHESKLDTPAKVGTSSDAPITRRTAID